TRWSPAARRPGPDKGFTPQRVRGSACEDREGEGEAPEPFLHVIDGAAAETAAGCALDADVGDGRGIHGVTEAESEAEAGAPLRRLLLPFEMIGQLGPAGAEPHGVGPDAGADALVLQAAAHAERLVADGLFGRGGRAAPGAADRG